MKALAAAALTLTALVSPMWSGTAQAAPSPVGTLCGLAAVGSPVFPDVMTGVLFAGPLVFTDDTNPTVTYAGKVFCTVQINAPLHEYADAASVEGAVTATEAFAAGSVMYTSDEGDNVYVCTHVDVGFGQILYWASSNDPLVEGWWSTHPAVPCALKSNADLPGEDDPTYDLLHSFIHLVNSVICPVLAIVFPPQGDVGILWDCPPYDGPLTISTGGTGIDFGYPDSATRMSLLRD